MRKVVEESAQREAAALDPGPIPLVVLAGIAAREVVVEAGRAPGEAERRQGHALGDVAVFEELRRAGGSPPHAGEAEGDFVDGGGGEGDGDGSAGTDGHGHEHEHEHEDEDEDGSAR